MKSRGHNLRSVLYRMLYRIALEELIEGAKEVIEIKRIDEKLYKLVVLVEDKYIVHAVIRLTPSNNEGYIWRLVDFSWEEEK